MTNPTTPGRYRVKFKGTDNASEQQSWYYFALLTYSDGWLFNGKPANMKGAVSWELNSAQ